MPLRAPPLNTGSASRPHLGFPDQETSWTPIYNGGIRELGDVRGALASGPGSEHFPNNPTATKRWNEGWTNFNAALNVGLAYMLADRQAAPAPLAVSFPLEISEVLAEPSGNALGEFIELHNPTDQPVRLEGIVLSGDITFPVPNGTVALAPGARCLIVRDIATFEALHGTSHPVIGTYTGDLDDAGGVLIIGDVTGSTLLTLDTVGLPRYAGHSQTAEAGGWRLSANLNGSPGSSDTIEFSGDPNGDIAADGVPNLVHHAVTGTDRPFEPLRLDSSGPGLVVYVTRNLSADDTQLDLQWSINMSSWTSAGEPDTEVPDGDRLSEWSFHWEEWQPRMFFRLRATK